MIHKTNSTQNSRITSVNRDAANEWLHKEHSKDGIVIVSDTNAATSAKYYGFVVTAADTQLSSITYLNSNLIEGDITSLTFQSGYYPIPGGFSTLTLSAGAVILLKDNNL